MAISSVFGVGAILSRPDARAFPGLGGPTAVAAAIALPLLSVDGGSVVRCRTTRRARELRHARPRTFASCWRSKTVLRTLLLFCLPASSFALTNSLGGLGRDFAASERFVALIAGFWRHRRGRCWRAWSSRGWSKRVTPLLLYLAIGSTGALFTLSLLLLPRAPGVFALALIGQNIFQASAFVVENTIIFRTIGEDNPLAATQFGLLAAGLPHSRSLTCRPSTGRATAWPS